MKDIFTLLQECAEITIPEDKKEGFTKLFRENYKTINEHKKVFDELAAAKDTIQKLSADVEKYSGTDATIQNLQQQLKGYQDAETARKSEETFRTRFDAVKGDKKFVNTYTEVGIAEAFKSAISDTSNAGKSDADIFLSIVKDRSDVFVNAHRSPDIPGMGAHMDGAIDAEAFKQLPMAERMRFANEHLAEYKIFTGGNN